MSEAVDTVDVNELLDERAAARRLGISPRAMWGLADSGAIPFIRIGGSRTRGLSLSSGLVLA